MRAFLPAAALVCVTMFLGCTPAPATDAPPAEILGPGSEMGRGEVYTYARFGAAGTPAELGVAFAAGALDDLPTAHSDGRRCMDNDGDGRMDLATECAGWHEWVLPLPSEASRRGDIPFKWVLLNWNAHGHIPPGVYDSPHFDVHFMMARIEDVFAIQRGTCGPELVRCDQFEIARRPLPAGYVPSGFQDVEAVAPAMGNHLIDLGGPEFGGEPFTRTWIYGTYGGRVTFWEEMTTLAYLSGNPDGCFDIETPPAVESTGYYPTRVCYAPGAPGEVRLSLQGFELREGEAVTAAAPSGG